MVIRSNILLQLLLQLQLQLQLLPLRAGLIWWRCLQYYMGICMHVACLMAVLHEDLHMFGCFITIFNNITWGFTRLR